MRPVRPPIGFQNRPFNPFHHHRTMGTYPTMADHQRLMNADPNEFMFQLPMEMQGQTMEMMGDGVGQNGREQAIDLKALNERLQTLGLHHPSSEDISRALAGEPVSPIQTPASTHGQRLGSSFHTPRPRSQPGGPADGNELGPQDSISMYRSLHPSAPPSGRSSRRGGTNVDPGEGREADYTPEERFEDDWVSHGGVTLGTPRSGVDSQEYLTLAPTTPWTTGTLAGNMYTMRNRLEQEVDARDHKHADELSRQLHETSDLAATLAKLETAEDQLRTLQATLIAERVARTQIERENDTTAEDMKDCRNELASAVRALRRAREEGKRTDEEKRRLARCFEETKTQLFRYHEELKVRDARARGREEGRAEAWQEAERWMGGSPPIPVKPIQALPEAVLRQTPMMQPMQSPQQAQTQYLQPQPYQSAPQQPLYQAQPQYQQPQPHPYAPQHSSRQGHHATTMPQGIPTATAMRPQAGVDEQGQQLKAAGQQQGSTQHTQGQDDGQQQQAQSRPNQEQLSQHEPQYLKRPPNSIQQVMAEQPRQTAHGLEPPYVLGQMGVSYPSAPPMPQMQQQQQFPFMMPQQAMQPMMVPMMPMATQVSISPPRSGQPDYGHISRSAPHRTTDLPSNPARATTIVHQTPRREPANMQQTPQQQQSSRPPRTASSTGVRPPRLDSVSRPNAADSYLDRMKKEPHIKQMLSGAPSKTIHSSAVLTADSRTQRSPSLVDKPLPNPFIPQNGNHTRQTTRGPSRTGTNTTEAFGSRRGHRPSLSEGLHAHSHTLNHVPDGDRYPTFPGANGQGRSHSRQSSYGSMDPAAFVLPLSADASSQQTPLSEHRGRLSSRPTPLSNSVRSRSRVAGALRKDADLGGPELPNIDEVEEAHAREQARQRPQPAPIQSTVMRNLSPPERQQAPRRAPSMPHMRWQPRMPVMPQPLAGGRPRSEHISRGENRDQLSAMYGRDRAVALTDRLPGPKDAFHPPGTHNLFVPPEHMPRAVSGGIEGVQGPRHSALGLEGLNGHEDSRKAPTITVQPPSSRSNNLSVQPSQVASSRSNPPATPEKTHDPSHQPIDRSSSDKQIHHGQYKEPRHDADAHDVPLPTPRSQAPIAHVTHPHDIPLPKSHPHAPTAYTAQSPRTDFSPDSHRAPRSLVDLAKTRPLPPSRTLTVRGTPGGHGAATVITETDREDPDRGRSRAQSDLSSRRTVRRKPVPEPSQVPLPVSRAASHRPRASSYARTEGTIEEVTEEESGRENRGRKRV